MKCREFFDWSSLCKLLKKFSAAWGYRAPSQLAPCLGFMSPFSSSSFTLSLSCDDSSGYSVSYSSNNFVLNLNLHLVGNEL